MARSLTIFVRHELAPANKRLMDALKVTVVVDPQAPACAFSGGSRTRYRVCPRCAAVERQRDRRARATAGQPFGRARPARRR